MARKTPDLNLQPEEQKVLSTDFNLFYRPQEAPLPAGMKEFTASLDNFVNGGATKAVIGAEVKMKKSERAKALKDYKENKGKFRDAVKNGEIDKTANPYYLEKYKELTLNSFANEFTERVLQNYENSGVSKDLTEGAFEKFYKENLGKFIKEKELGFFKPEELELGFFKETSAYRQQLEATHKQNLLNEFNKDFDNKIKERIVGTFEKYKTWDTDQLSEGEIQAGVTKWDKISEVLQGEIQSLFDVTGNGRDVVDTIFDGLELYVTSTDDYEFALQLIQQIPKRLIAGTDTIASIGRLKNKQQELKDLLIEKQNEKLNNEVQFEKNKDNLTVARTHNFLEKSIKDNPDFNLSQWINDKGRTDAERIAGEQYKKSLQFDGGNSDDTDIINEIEKHLNNNEYAKASKLAFEALENGDIRASTYKSYKSTVIPNAQSLEGNVYFDDFYISGQFKAFEKIITSGVSDGLSDAITVRALMRKKLLAWLKANENNEKYAGELGEIQKQEDFNAYFDKNITLIKMTGEYNSLFGRGQFELTGKSSVNILEEKMEKAETNATALTQKISDASYMTKEEFQKKYNEDLDKFKKENDIK